MNATRIDFTEPALRWAIEWLSNDVRRYRNALRTHVMGDQGRCAAPGCRSNFPCLHYQLGVKAAELDASRAVEETQPLRVVPVMPAYRKPYLVRQRGDAPRRELA